MQNFMKTIINALKFWIKHKAFTVDEAIEVTAEMGIIEPLMAIDGTIYTAPDGAIYTLD